MKKFEVNKKYQAISIGDSQIKYTFIVTARTEKTVTLFDLSDKSTFTRKITNTQYNDHECVRPYGKYSMSPILRAENEA